MAKKKLGGPPPCSSCGATSTHKIGEEPQFLQNPVPIIPGPFHNLTNYLCCTCFKLFVGDCDEYPYRAFNMRHGTLYNEDDEDP